MKNKSCIALVEMRTSILQSAENNPGPEYDRKLDEIDKMLSRMRAEEAEALRREERVKIMKEAIALGLWKDLQYFIEDAKRERHKPYTMPAGIMADLLFQYIKTIWPEAETVRYGVEQWIVVTDIQKQELRRCLQKRMEKRIVEQIELQRALDEARRIAGGKDADGKRTRKKTAQ